MIKTFRELEVWQKAHALVLDGYKTTSDFPGRERFGIVSQLRRAAASVPANIAEGFGRSGTGELIQFLGISNGSLEEARYLFILSNDLQYLKAEDFQRLDRRCSSIGQMLGALANSLRNRGNPSHGPRVTGHG